MNTIVGDDETIPWIIAYSAWPGKVMSVRTTHWLVAAALAAMVLGAVLSRVIEPGGSRRDGDIAMAAFASYTIGQFMPLFY
jgi:hypothetical protein